MGVSTSIISFRECSSLRLSDCSSVACTDLDGLSTIFRRVLNRKPIMQADRGHLHHKLIDMVAISRQSLLCIIKCHLGLSAIVLADKGFICNYFSYYRCSFRNRWC